MKKAERNRLIQELRHMVNPEDLEGVSWLIHIYMSCKMDLSGIVASLKKIQVCKQIYKYSHGIRAHLHIFIP